jgi:hypothetical protein
LVRGLPVWRRQHSINGVAMGVEMVLDLTALHYETAGYRAIMFQKRAPRRVLSEPSLQGPDAAGAERRAVAQRSLPLAVRRKGH